MNENDVILNCLSSNPPNKRKRRIMREIGSLDFDTNTDDAITRWASRIKDPPKKKYLSQWNGVDFLRYLNKNLNLYEQRLVSTSARDSDVVNKIYDYLVNALGSLVDNKLLRDYFDWWVASYATKFQVNGKDISIYTLLRDYYLDAFIKQHQHQPAESSAPAMNESVEISDETLYSTGGISVLLMNRGIVNAYRVLTNVKHISPSSCISTAMQSFSKSAVITTVETTISLAPYPKAHSIDFITIIKSLLDFHEIQAYNNLDYKEFFKDIN